MSKEVVYQKTLVIEDFLPFCREIVECFICPLCNGILFRPVADSCGHLFCSKCFDIYLTTSQLCPVDVKPLVLDQGKEIPVLGNLLNMMSITCTNKSRGCDWSGKLKDYLEHVENTCKKEKVNCPNEGCNKVFCREDMNIHQNICGFKIKKCPDCKKDLMQSQFEYHQTQCPQFKLKCPQNCGEFVRRQDLKFHIEKDCNNTKIICVFEYLGCKQMMLKKELNYHLQNDGNKHLLLFLQDIKSFADGIENQFDKLISARIENSRIINYIKEKVVEKIDDMRFDLYRPTYYNLPIGESSSGQETLITKKRSRSDDEESQKAQNFSGTVAQNLLFVDNVLSKTSSESEENTNIPRLTQKKNIKYFFLDFLPDDVIVNGSFIRCQSNPKKEHIYVFGTMEILSSNRNSIVKWKTIVYPKSNWVGVGLCDKNQVILNDMKFFSPYPGYKNGTFCISTNGYSWNSNNFKENDVILPNFIPKIQKEEYLFTYMSESKTLYYEIGHRYSGKLTNVYATKGDRLNLCIVLLNSGDEVEVQLINDV